MRYTYELDNSCDNIIIEYANLYDRRNSMSANHYHDFYELYFNIGDQMRYVIDGKSYDVKKYDVVFIDKGVYHRSNYENGKKERILMMFREEFFNVLCDTTPITEILKTFSKNPVISLDEDMKKVLYDSFMKLNNMYEQDRDNLFQLQVFIMQMLISISNCIKNGMVVNAQETNDEKNQIVAEVIEYINKHYNSKITLDLLMSRFYIDKYYLCKIFKKFTGETVIEFINNKRLAEAKQLLKSSDYTVAKVCERVGFQNQNYFNVLFKRSFNQTPSEFKKARKNHNN